MGHLDQLVLNSGSLLDAVVLGSQSGSTDQGVANADLAAAVALTMIAGETLDDHAGELILTVQEDVLVGDKDVVQNNQSLLAAELGVTNVDRGTLFHLTGVAGLTAVDHVHTLGVGGASEGNSPILVSLAHGDGGPEDVPVRVDGTGLVALGAADHDTILTALHDMDIHVGISLLAGGLGTVALGVGHGAVDGQVVVLNEGQELLEVLMIVGAILLVNLVGGREDSVEGVHTDAALEAGSGLLAQQTLHLHLVHQVLSGLMQVGEAVDLLAGQAGVNGHQICVLGILCGSIGHSNAVDGGTDHGVIHPVLDFLAEHVNTGVQLAQAFNILLCGHQCHFIFPPQLFGGLTN